MRPGAWPVGFPQGRNPTTGSYRSSIGMSYKVIVVFWPSSLQSDRGLAYKVIVEKTIDPQGVRGKRGLVTTTVAYD